MTELTEILFAAILAVDLLLVASSRLLHCIRLVAVQGLLLGFLPLVIWNWHDAPPHTELILMAAVNIGIKCIALPYLLARTMRSAHVCRELEPMIGYSFSILIALLIAGGSFLVCRRIDLADLAVSPLSAPVAFSTLLIGLFIIVARRKAITQAIGFLVFENGIAIFGTGMALEYGFVVELGILLDIFVLVFVMGIAVFQISREFDHIDSDRLNKLDDWHGAEEATDPAEDTDL